MSLYLLLISTFLVTSYSIPLATQVHLALTDEISNKVGISWITYSPYLDVQNRVVFLSLNPQFNDASVINDCYTLSLDDHKHFYHHCTSFGLEINTLYYYKCGNNSEIYSFTSPNRQKSGVSFIAIGDMGVTYTNNTANLVKSLVNKPNSFDFVAHVGDISYCDDYDRGAHPNHDYMSVYDTWGDRMEAVMSSIPYMIIPGNHEASCHVISDIGCPENLRNFTVYRYYFNMPNHQKSQNMWYSFNYGNTHFLMYDTETDYNGSPFVPYEHKNHINKKAGGFGDQISFIENDLKLASNNENISWIIAMGHRPMYSSIMGNPPYGIDYPPLTQYYMKQVFEPLFLQYGVDLVLHGHIHAYERIYPIANDSIVSYNYSGLNVPVYITNGAAGNIENHTVYNSDILQNYTAYYDDTHWGISVVNVVNKTHLNYQFLYSENGEIGDEIWIVRK